MRFKQVALSALVWICQAAAQTTPTVSVTTWHNDMGRTGANTQETILTTSNVNTGSFGRLCNIPADAQIYAQPLYVPGVTIAGNLHNVLYVATENNSVYAYDADSCGSQPLWHVNLGTPVTTQSVWAIYPIVGILSTPVIDVSRQAIYLVTETLVSSNVTFSLHSLNLATGTERVGSPVVISGSVTEAPYTIPFIPSDHIQRTSLLELNGDIYIGFGGHDDQSPWHGWIFGYDGLSLRRIAITCLSPIGNGAAVWQSGAGFAADTFGNLYFSTGNGDFDVAEGDYGDSVIKMNAASGLTITSYFTPSNQAYFDADDLDVSAGGVIIMPDTAAGRMVIATAKNGTTYLMNANALGGYNTTDNVLQEWSMGSTHRGGDVYYNNMYYFWGEDDVLRMYSFNGTSFAAFATGSYQTPNYQANTPSMSVSANGTTAGTGILWAAHSQTKADGGDYPALLHAIDASSGAELWRSNQKSTDYPGSWAKWVPPTIANGKVYLATFDSGVAVYGLNPLTISITSLPAAIQYEAYSQTLAAFGGSGVYTWSISAGTLPAGLSLSSAGLLSGTPTGTTSATFTVEVTDSNNLTATEPYTLTVTQPPALTITTTSLTTGAQFVAYNLTLTASGNIGTEIWSVSSGALPAGLSLSSAGVLSGTPTGSSATFTIKVTDTTSRVATHQFSLVVNPASPMVIATTSLPVASESVAYNQTISASGGIPPYTWSISAGALPAGLSFSSVGVLSGIPTVNGSATFTVQVTDTTARTTSQPFTLTINAPPALIISTTSLPVASENVAYNQTISASGGIPPYTWSISAGVLPAGLSFSAGVLSGTPTVSGSATVTVQVTDSIATTTSEQLTVTVNPPPPLTISTTTITPAIETVAYSQTLAASGGSGAYTWSVSAGSPPAGFALSSAGVLSGVSQVTESAAFTVQVTDAVGDVTTRQMILNVNPLPSPITGPIQQNVAGSRTATVTVTIAAPQPGDALIAAISSNQGSSNSVKSITGGGVTWVKAQSSSVQKDTEIWYGLNSTGNGTSIVVTMSAGYIAANVSEWSGINTVTPIDGTGASTSGSLVTSATTGSVTLSNPGSLVFAAMGSSAASSTVTMANGFTALTTESEISALISPAYYIPNVLGTYSTSWTFTYGSSYETEIVAFLPQPVQ